MAEVLEVVLITDGQFQLDVGHEVRPGRPRRPRPCLELAPGLRVECLGPRIAAEVLDATDQTGKWLDGRRPERQYGELYSFVRHRPDVRPNRILPLDGDPGQRLVRCLALSRLVRCNYFAMEHSARIVLEDDGSVSQAVPLFEPGPFSRVYAPTEYERGWLDDDELRALGTIIGAVETHGWENHPIRLRRALRWHELAYLTPVAEPRTVMMANGWECLTTIEERDVRWQFVRRLLALCEVAGHRGMDEAAAHDAYSLRCALVHGKAVPDVLVTRCHGDRAAALSEANRVGARMERALRDVLRWLCVHRELDSALADDGELARRIPVGKPA
jgi:hypothetical protein